MAAQGVLKGRVMFCEYVVLIRRKKECVTTDPKFVSFVTFFSQRTWYYNIRSTYLLFI